MKLLNKINNGIYLFEKAILSVAVLGIFVVLIANVFTRFILQSGISWAEEVGALCYVFICFIGVSYSTRSGRSITMSAVYDILPPKAQKAMTYFIDIIAFFSLIGFGILGLSYVVMLVNSGRVSVALRLPLWIPYLIVPIGFWLGAFQYLILILMNIHNPKETVKYIYKEPDPDMSEESLIEKDNKEEK